MCKCGVWVGIGCICLHCLSADAVSEEPHATDEHVPHEDFVQTYPATDWAALSSSSGDSLDWLGNTLDAAANVVLHRHRALSSGFAAAILST